MYDENLTALVWSPIAAMEAGAEPASLAPGRSLLQAVRHWFSAPLRPWAAGGDVAAAAEAAAAEDDPAKWDEVELRAAVFYFSGLW